MRIYAFVAALVGVGCTRAPPHPPYAPQPTTALVEAPFPPPPARVEILPKRPAERAVWVDGEWSWQGRKWAWKQGRWLLPPPGAKYSPWTTVRGADGRLFFAAGAWRDGQGAVIAEPTPLAYGFSGTMAAAAEDGGS